MVSDAITLRADLVGVTDWKSRLRAAVGQSRARFQLDHPFDGGAPIIAYRFITELQMLFGRQLEPVEVADGCIAIELAFPSSIDNFGRPFTTLMYSNPRYHAFFHWFAVDKIYLQGFPNTGNLGSRFQVLESGQPVPY